MYDKKIKKILLFIEKQECLNITFKISHITIYKSEKNYKECVHTHTLLICTYISILE